MAEQAPNQQADVAIVGGGMVGMALALSLAAHGMASVMLESQALAESTDQDPSCIDERTLVINPASQNFWQNLGVWSAMEPHTTPIQNVHVSNQGQFGMVRFDHKELQVPQLGHVIAAQKMADILQQQVQQTALVTVIQPAELTAFKTNDSWVELDYQSQGKQHKFQAALMVGADGVQSGIRKQLQLATEIKSYEKTAIICGLKTSQHHHNRAFERLTQHGPMALLPHADRFGLVWSMPTADSASSLALDDEAFMAAAQQQFGYRAGEFLQVGRRSSYPLYQIKVPKQHSQRVLLMGNAAHAVSPVSAQGLNLAVRGIRRLVNILSKQHQQGLDLGSDAVLSVYQAASDEDQHRTLNYTDDLMTWFKIDEPLVNLGRSFGLLTIDANPALKRWLYQTAGGLRS